jgi:hypothetical protein
MLAGIDRTQFQLVSIRVFLDREHARDDDIGKVGAGGTALFDLKTSHCQKVTELISRQWRIDKGAQPRL